MKTIILSLSPRKSFSASMYYSKVVKAFITQGQVSIIRLKTQKQYIEFEQQLDNTDNLVIVTPVYVDTVPSTVLKWLLKIQNYANGKNIKLNIYSITNCGFYEGEQNRLAQKTIEIWSEKCKFDFKGGLGIGAGVMVAFTRILPLMGIGIETLIILIRMIICLLNGNFTLSDIFYHYIPYSFLIQSCLYLLWNMGFFVNGFKLAKNIERSNKTKIKYTTIWFCPRFLFVIIASIYWFVASVVWYRGAFWRLHRQPKI